MAVRERRIRSVAQAPSGTSLGRRQSQLEAAAHGIGIVRSASLAARRSSPAVDPPARTLHRWNRALRSARPRRWTRRSPQQSVRSSEFDARRSRLVPPVSTASAPRRHALRGEHGPRPRARFRAHPALPPCRHGSVQSGARLPLFPRRTVLANPRSARPRIRHPTPHLHPASRSAHAAHIGPPRRPRSAHPRHARTDEEPLPALPSSTRRSRSAHRTPHPAARRMPANPRTTPTAG